ncbi:MAG TPA: recombinase family protein [Phycisphaerae bacterium]|nr:recombinase family protein [Phycisphaerae bacterium]HSA29982.1 recombinase family protein [Phycisphaerae bacterium]
MAAEYSRELSCKVFKGQCNLIQKGYRQGGPAGYGLRRMLIDQTGQPKGLLKRGEHKSLQTDRVILVPGPDEEVQTVRWIYAAFTKEGKRETDIADALNARGITNEYGRPWTRGMVHQVLINEKYVGNNVYNRVSFKLKKKRVRNPPEMWVRADEAFAPVIDRESFYVVRGIILERNRTFSDDEMLDSLKALIAKHEQISGLLIDETEGMPSSASYRSRFGSLVRAYRLVGYTPERDYEYIEINRHLRKLHPETVSGIIEQLRAMGVTVVRDDVTDLLRINDEYSASLVLSRCRRTATGSLRWLVRFDEGLCPDITIVARMDPPNEQPTDFYLLPRIDMDSPRIRLCEFNAAYLDTYRFDTLDCFLEMAKRVKLKAAV